MEQVVSDPTQPALTHPSPDLRSFPSTHLSEGRRVFRSHKAGYHPWWFSIAPRSGGGRFDLSTPRGTCYVADTIEAAVRERLRETILASRVITPLLADSFLVSSFAMPRGFTCAHIGVTKAARFGVTRELAALTPGHYPLSREWATAFDDAGFEGIRYGARFTPGPANAWALFGPAGDTMSPYPLVDTVISGREACHKTKIKVLPIPRLSALTVLNP